MTTNNCSSSSSRNMCYDNTIPIKKTVHILDNELRFRSIPNSFTSLNIQNNIDRFDELTHFFNVINGLFHQSTFTFGLNTYHLAPLFHLPEMNVGFNIHIDQQNLEQKKIDLLKNMTLYSIISSNKTNIIENNNQEQNQSRGIIKFHTSNKNLMLNINHRWTPSFTTTFRLGTIPEKRLWSHIEYRHPNVTYEFIGEYGTSQLSSIQFSYLSCLLQRMNYRIEGGIDFKVGKIIKINVIILFLSLYSDDYKRKIH